MCGVAGAAVFSPEASSQIIGLVESLVQSLQHRGPDHSQINQCSPWVVLGSARLAITDPNNTDANMPMFSSDGRLCVSFNGEIYNHHKIRHDIPNYPFITKSDTETLLAAFQASAEQSFAWFDGMFAAALYDTNLDMLYLVADPSGQKTIYYCETADGIFFSSEIEALLKTRVAPWAWNREILAEVAAQVFHIGDATHVSQIRRVPPGHYIRIRRGRLESINRYYKIPIGDQTNSDIPSVTESLTVAISHSCKIAAQCEVPSGILLSGGIDSSTVLSLVRPYHDHFYSYSVGFEPIVGDSFEQPCLFDEFKFSRALASQFNTIHREIVLSPQQYCEYFDRWTAICDCPLGAKDATALTALFDTAKSDCKVIFTGSGPDEIFDGYDNGKKLAQYNPASIATEYFKEFQYLFDVELDRLVPGIAVEDCITEKIENFLAPYKETVSDPLQLTQLIDFHGRMATYEFSQMDQISMAFSIEARSPLIGAEVCREAFNFTPSLKQCGGASKGVYKHACAPFVTKDILERPKAAFPIPPQMWFSKPFEERAETIFDINSGLRTLGIFDMNYLSNIWNKKTYGFRNVFYRLLVIDRVIRWQSRWVSS